MIVLDTTVLVYAAGSEHPLRAPCRALVDAIGASELRATTTVEVIQEFVHVSARRRTRRDASDLAAAYVALLTPLHRPDESDLRRGFELFTSQPQLGCFDSVLAASVLNAPHLSLVVSADRGFSAVPGLTHVDPGRSDLAATLGIGGS